MSFPANAPAVYPGVNVYPGSALNNTGGDPDVFYDVVVDFSGNGVGQVNGPGIATLINDNSEQYLGQTVQQLTAVPIGESSIFRGWSFNGGTTITSVGNPLNLRVTGPKNVTAVFDVRSAQEAAKGGFYPTHLDNDWATTRGPGRIMIAPITQGFPSELAGLIDLTTYDAVGAWEDIGATLGGINISTNHENDVQFGTDGMLEFYPTNSTCTVTTALAENTLEHLKLAMQGSAITGSAVGGTEEVPLLPSPTLLPDTDLYPGTTTITGAPTGNERELSVGTATKTDILRLAILFRKDSSRKIRAYVFRLVKPKVNTTLTFNKTGPQQSIPVEFTCIPDYTISEVKHRYLEIIEQSTGQELDPGPPPPPLPLRKYGDLAYGDGFYGDS